MNPQQQQARRTVAEDLRASLRLHKAEVGAGLEAQATALESRIEAATQAVESRAAILHRDFIGRFRWLLLGR